jgi:oligogalacturonide lyase
MCGSLSASLLAASTAITKKARPLPAVGEFVRFTDPATENPVVRLTNPASNSLLPAAPNKFVSLRDRFLIFSSDRTGKLAPFRLDLRTGMLEPLAQTTQLEPRSLCLDTTGRLVYLIDGQVLKELSFSTRKMRSLAEDISWFSGPSQAGSFVVIRKGNLDRLEKRGASLASEVDPWCLIRPDGSGCLFRRSVSEVERQLWYVAFDSTVGGKPVLAAQGRISEVFWSPGGGSVLLLREVPSGTLTTSEVVEINPETGETQQVSKTSQFASFAPNGDASVFVGASRSRAQPTVMLLVRSIGREITLCEHRASKPTEVLPAFSPDSRRVYFQTDSQGKSALFSVNVELLVEPTAPTSS